MRITALYDYSAILFKETALYSLSDENKRIGVIAVGIFSCMALLNYLVYRSCFSHKKIVPVEEDNQVAEDNQVEEGDQEEGLEKKKLAALLKQAKFICEENKYQEVKEPLVRASVLT